MSLAVLMGHPGPRRAPPSAKATCQTASTDLKTNLKGQFQTGIQHLRMLYQFGFCSVI